MVNESSLPVDGAQLLLRFQPADASPKKINQLSGTLTLLNSPQQQTLMIDDIMPFLGKQIEHPTLEKHDLKLSPVRAGPGINLTVESKNAFNISEITALDPSGGASSNIYSGRQIFNGKPVFSFHAQKEFPQKLPVRIFLNPVVEKLVVPFEFKDLAIPSDPVNN